MDEVQQISTLQSSTRSALKRARCRENSRARYCTADECEIALSRRTSSGSSTNTIRCFQRLGTPLQVFVVDVDMDHKVAGLSGT